MVVDTDKMVVDDPFQDEGAGGDPFQDEGAVEDQSLVPEHIQEEEY